MTLCVTFIKFSLLNRPSRNGLVYLFHKANGLFKSYHNLLVMNQLIIAQRSAFTVFEPFLADLVATDITTA